MNALIIYDTKFGITERIARAIGGVLEPAGWVEVSFQRAGDVSPSQLAGENRLLVMGSTAQAHGLSPSMRYLLDHLPPAALSGIPALVFDTRSRKPAWHTNSGAGEIARRLKRAGCRLILEPESFFAEAREGPLEPGEFERAVAWAQAAISQLDAMRAVEGMARSAP